MNLFIPLTFLRLTLPFSMLRWPLAGILACSVVDMYDWQFAPKHNDADYALYQKWDKSMDLYYWVFALVVVTHWPDKLAKKIAFFLFSYRLIGLGIFLLTSWRPALFFFPNVFENLVIFYLAYLQFSHQSILFKSKGDVALVLSSLLGPKLLHEYFIHVLQHQPWELYDIGHWLGLTGLAQEYTNYVSWGILMYGISMVVCGWYIRRRKKIAKK